MKTDHAARRGSYKVPKTAIDSAQPIPDRTTEPYSPILAANFARLEANASDINTLKDTLSRYEKDVADVVAQIAGLPDVNEKDGDQKDREASLRLHVADLRQNLDHVNELIERLTDRLNAVKRSSIIDLL